MSQQQTRDIAFMELASTITFGFDGKKEKLELFQELFHTMLKKQSKKTEASTISSHTRKKKKPYKLFTTKTKPTNEVSKSSS